MFHMFLRWLLMDVKYAFPFSKCISKPFQHLTAVANYKLNTGKMIMSNTEGDTFKGNRKASCL